MSHTHESHDEHENGHAEGGCCGGHGGGGGGCCKTKPEAMKAMSVEELEKLPPLALVSRYRRGIEWIDRRIFQLDERAIDQAFLPDAGVGQWPVRVLVGHLADAELAAAHRLRRMVGEDRPVVTMWDENAFVESNIYQNGPKEYSADPDGDHARVMNALGGSLAVIHTVRQWIGQWLLSLDDSAFDRVMMHPERGEVSVKRYIAMNTWHLEHHAAFLTRKMDRMVGAQAPAPSGGGCGCKH